MKIIMTENRPVKEISLRVFYEGEDVVEINGATVKNRSVGFVLSKLIYCILELLK